MSKKKKIVIPVLFFLFCAVFLFSGYRILGNMKTNKEAENSYRELRAGTRAAAPAGSPEAEEAEPASSAPAASGQIVSMDFSSLREINPEIVCWIRSEGTNFDYPVLQTDDNSYYLTHLYNGEYNKNGSVFMDPRNNGDLSDKNTVLYGHHMSNDVIMFGSLTRYKDQAFYAAHPVMTLFTPDGDYAVELISGTVEDGSVEFVRFDFTDDDDFLNYVEELRRRSAFTSDVEMRPEDRIISLCTCSYEWDNARFLLVGRLVKLYETPRVIALSKE